MNDETLKHLLQRADSGTADASPNVSAGDLLAAVRRRRVRTVGFRVAAASVVVAVVIVGVGRMRSIDQEQGAPLATTSVIADHETVPAVNVDELRMQLAVLEQEAVMRSRVVQAVLASTELEKADDSDLAASDVSLVQAEAARSAALSWQYANLVETDLGNPAAARREYQRVAERFPGTEWATLSQVSLQRLSKPKDTTSL